MPLKYYKAKKFSVNPEYFIIHHISYNIWAVAWDFQHCGVCNQQSLRSACAYTQSDQSLC